MSNWAFYAYTLSGLFGWIITNLIALYPEQVRQAISAVFSGPKPDQIVALGKQYLIPVSMVSAFLTFLSGYTFRSLLARRARRQPPNPPELDSFVKEPGGATEQQVEIHRPDYSHWDKSLTLNLWNAAHLWAELEPGHYTEHPGGPPPFYAIFSELKQSVNLGILKADSLIYTDPVKLPRGSVPAANRHAIVSRDELRRYAINVRNEQPKFLFLESRSSKVSKAEQAESIVTERLSLHYTEGLALNNKWRDSKGWSAEWAAWNGKLTATYKDVSELLAITKEVNVPQAVKKYALAGDSGLSEPVIDRAVLAERLDGLRDYLASKIKP